jgi:hypothetical protein
VGRGRRCGLGVLGVCVGLGGRLPGGREGLVCVDQVRKEAYPGVDDLFQVVPLNRTHRFCLVQLQRDGMVRRGVLLVVKTSEETQLISTRRIRLDLHSISP